MTFTQIELEYLATQRLGRLATIAPDGYPQNNPVGFFVDAERGTIDIGGHRMGASRKFASVQANPRVSFVVDGGRYPLLGAAVNGWLIEATGVDVRSRPAIGVVVEPSCRYFAPLRFPDVVTAGSGLERLGETSVVYRLALFSPHTGDPAAV